MQGISSKPVQFQGLGRQIIGGIGAVTGAYLAVRHGVHVNAQEAADVALTYGSVKLATKDTPYEPKVGKLAGWGGQAMDKADQGAEAVRDKATPLIKKLVDKVRQGSKKATDAAREKVGTKPVIMTNRTPKATHVEAPVVAPKAVEPAEVEVDEPATTEAPAPATLLPGTLTVKGPAIQPPGSHLDEEA